MLTTICGNRQGPESRALRGRTLIPRHQHLRHQPIPVALDRTAQRQQFVRQVLVGHGGIAERGQPGDLRPA